MTVTQPIPTISPSHLPSTGIQRLLVATDFSENSAAALEWVLDFVKANKQGEVLFVHAVDPDLLVIAGAEEPIVRSIRQNLAALESLSRAAGVIARTERHVGKPWAVVSRMANEAQADLIVLGAHGKSRLSERLLGTVADRIIRTCSVPVLVIRERPVLGESGVRTVLVATDFSEEAALATSMAVRLLQSCPNRTRLVLFHAIALPINYADFNTPTHVPKYWDDAERDAARRMETLAAGLRSDRLDVEVKTFRDFPGKAILDAAQNLNADIIAMGTQGRTGLNRFFLGSVAEHVLHHAKCPVLTVRQPDADEPIHVSAE